MDFLDIIITIAILCVGGLFSGNKVFGKKVSPQPASSNKGGAEDVDFNIEEELVEDDSELYEGYFTYETIDEDPVEMSVSSNAQSAKTVEAPSAAGGVREMVETGSLEENVFDLRKAVIYQTILERVGA